MFDLGMTGYRVVGGNLETVANGGNIIQAEAAAATLLMQAIVVWSEVVAFGVYITEDFTAQATDAVAELLNRSKVGGTDTSLVTLTLGQSNANSLKKGDGTVDAATAIALDADLLNGHVVFANLHSQGESVVRKYAPGDILILNHKTAGTGAGGAYAPFVILKESGPDFTSAKVWRETT